MIIIRSGTWTEEEISFIRSNWQKLSDKELTDAIGSHTFRAVKAKRNELRLYRRPCGIRHTIEEAKCKFEERDYTLLANAYKSNSTKMPYICNKHKEVGIQYITYGHFLCGEGCMYCGREKSAAARRYSDEFYKDICKDMNFTYIGQYTENKHTMVQYICNRHKFAGIQKKEMSNLIKGVGCPYCKSSKMETAMYEILTNLNIKFTPQKKMEGCRFKYRLPFDFYLNDYNVLIECDGIQHFEPVDFAGNGCLWAEENFRKIKDKDKIKNDYCHNNNIPLIRIPYYAQENMQDFFLGELEKYNIKIA